MGYFWAKYILFVLKKYRGVIFNDTEEWCKVWRGTDLMFQNWHEELDKFWPEHSKVYKIFTLVGSFWAKLSFITLKGDAKFEEKLTGGLENDRMNLVNFHHSTWKSQNWDFDGILLSKVENAWA